MQEVLIAIAQEHQVNRDQNEQTSVRSAQERVRKSPHNCHGKPQHSYGLKSITSRCCRGQRCKMDLERVKKLMVGGTVAAKHGPDPTAEDPLR